MPVSLLLFITFLLDSGYWRKSDLGLRKFIWKALVDYIFKVTCTYLSLLTIQKLLLKTQIPAREPGDLV